jgi:hypothetical protein
MAKSKSTQPSGTKARGRTNIPGGNASAGASPTKPNVPQEMRREANRPVNAGGGGKHRGDRRDTNTTYTGNEKHAARGNNPRKDVSTRAR